MMKLMTLNQYRKMSKTALIRKITKTLRVMPKKRLAVLCYNITKAKLPRLKKRKSLKALRTGAFRAFEAGESAKGRKLADQYEMQSARKKRRKTKRKFSRKQLAAQRLFAKRARAGTLRKRRRR